MDKDYNLIQLIRGDDEAISIEMTDSNDVAVDVTGYTMQFTIAETQNRTDDTGVLFQKDVTNTTDPETGLILIELTNLETKLKIGKHYYDIQSIDPDERVKTLLRGGCEIIQDTTKRTV